LVSRTCARPARPSPSPIRAAHFWARRSLEFFLAKSNRWKP